MNKQNIVIGVAAVAVIVLAGIAIVKKPRYDSSPPTSATNPPAQTAALQTGGDAESIIRKAIDSRDASVCGNIDSVSDRQACETDVVITKASDAKDPGICDSIADSVFRTACKDNIVVVKARDGKNPRICDLMADKTRIADCKTTAGYK